MSTTPRQTAHWWASPAWCAEQLGGTKHGDSYRARCPAHGGDNPQSLRIAHWYDSHGNPVTRFYCFAHKCDVLDICAALGIALRNLFSVHVDHHKQLERFPPAKSPYIAQLKAIPTPTPDDIVQAIIEDDIATAPHCITESYVPGPDGTRILNPERVEMWRLAQTNPKAKEAFTKALKKSGQNTIHVWAQLAKEMGGV